MKKEKVVLINNIHYCKLPKDIENIEAFIELLTEKHNSFVLLEAYEETGCVAPYFVESELKTEAQYWNVSHIRVVKEEEIILLRKYEYEEKLNKIIQEKCVKCIHYSDDKCKQNDVSIYEQIDLNGKCYLYEELE